MKCEFCKKNKNNNEFVKSYSPFWEHNNYITCFCYDCVAEKFDLEDLNVGNRVCQQFNLAFFPEDWIKLFKHHDKKTALQKYNAMYFDNNYKTFDWSEQNEKIKQMAETGLIEVLIPELTPELEAKLRQRWGTSENITAEQLFSMEEKYNTIIADFNVDNELTKDVLQKAVRLSQIIDRALDSGLVDKDAIAQYKGLVKEFLSSAETADKGISSIAQIIQKIEYLGFKPSYDKTEINDRLDQAIKNIQDYNRDLFLGETLMQEQYEQMKQLLETADEEWEEEENELTQSTENELVW